ncbi:MAG TPA: DUF6690 family protein [Pirellulales bacterium]|nr:DUF6690 family protein [Pirellulales bacterium]
MFRRLFLTVAVLGAAVGVPYAASNWSKLKASVFGGPSANTPENTGAFKPVSATGSNPSYSAIPQLPAVTPDGIPLGAGVNPQAEQLPLVDLPEAFRWDISPQWVLSHWPRVSSGLPMPAGSMAENLQGMRVALISGMRVDDLAGSLTYYFNASQKCAKITFTGTTGDPQRLMALLVDRYDFKQFAASDPGVVRYEIRWNGAPTSTLVVRPAAIVRNSTPYERYMVQVSISDPAVK